MTTGGQSLHNGKYVKTHTYIHEAKSKHQLFKSDVKKSRSLTTCKSSNHYKKHTCNSKQKQLELCTLWENFFGKIWCIGVCCFLLREINNRTYTRLNLHTYTRKHLLVDCKVDSPHTRKPRNVETWLSKSWIWKIVGKSHSVGIEMHFFYRPLLKISYCSARGSEFGSRDRSGFCIFWKPEKKISRSWNRTHTPTKKNNYDKHTPFFPRKKA